MGQKAVEGESNFVAGFRQTAADRGAVGEGVDADDPAGFRPASVGVGKGDDVAWGHGSDGDDHGPTVSIDEMSFGVGGVFARQKAEANDDAELEGDTLASAAVADGGGGEVFGVTHSASFQGIIGKSFAVVQNPDASRR